MRAHVPPLPLSVMRYKLADPFDTIDKVGGAVSVGGYELAQAIEQVKLTSRTYHILEQMAQARSLTPSELVEDMIRQFQALENLALLRQEYQQLTDRALARTISPAEEKRMDAIGVELSARNKDANKSYILEQRSRQADSLIAESERLLDLAQQSAR